LKKDWKEETVMHVNQLTLKSYPSTGQMNASSASDELGMTVKGWLTRLIGCWHLEMSRPFSSHGQAYRVCLNCGAHRKFSLKNWQTQGDFYYNMPNRRSFRTISSISAVRRVAA
jgi:hypothetical protein